MNLALVFPPFHFEQMYNLPPLGLINLATALKDTHHRVRVFDFPLSIRLWELHLGSEIYRECADKVLEFESDLAAFSVQCTTYPPAIQIARLLKKLKPNIKIVFGGHNASFVDLQTLERFRFIDAIVRGEGETTFPELMRGLEGELDLRGVEGITLREGDRIIRNTDRALIEDLDSLPLSDYSFVPPPSVYRDACGIRRSIAILEVGRGCPHHCVYCSQSLLWRRRARTFSVGRLIREMQNLKSIHGAECFLLAYDQFTARKSFAEEFCRSVIDAGLNNTPWYCISRLDTVDKELLGLMREAGCESMCYGIDSGSKRTLSFIRKNIDSEILLRRVRETTETEIVPTLSFVIGFPHEEKADLEETLRLALKSAAAGNTNILVQMATILPGTDLHTGYSSILTREVDTYFSLGIEFDRGKRLASDEELIGSDPVLFSSFYNLPCPAGPLRKLNALAGHFTIISSLYPRSFLLLGLELDIPVYDLFFLFMDRIAGGGERALTPHACFAEFESFASDLLAGRELLRRYLPEIVRYETCLIRAAAHDIPSPFRIDPSRIADFKPLANEKAHVEQFTFNLPVIIFEAKSGRFGDFCPEQQTFLIFRQMRGKTEVLEINEFGADFLKLCNGQLTSDAIADQLYGKYGAETDSAEFLRLCAEAALSLADMGLFEPAAPA